MNSSALIVVDVQNAFIEYGTLPVPNGKEVIPVINRIAKAFQNIVITQDWHVECHSSFASTHTNKKPYDVIKLPYRSHAVRISGWIKHPRP
jgi:nicotinamidase/pyrazinamidase